MPRPLRRTSPITIVLAIVLCIGFVAFLFTPSSTAAATVYSSRNNAPATNELSPPTAPYRKDTKSGGKRIPPPVVHYQLNNVTTSTDPAANDEVVLILTPLARFYPGYWENLVKLSYPHRLIALGFIIPKTKEGNAATTQLQKAIKETQTGLEADRFASVTILRQEFDPAIASQAESERHKIENQKGRRSVMAKARNSLLFTTIGPSTAWVLWLDSDIVETPPTLIQDLASFDKAVIVPNCFQRYTNEAGQPDTRPYDYNSWQDSEAALKLAENMGPEEILLEGYSELATYRTLMAMSADKSADANERKLMPLDGVGGTALLVKAEVHRDGAMFPPFPFYHLIETEGFAKMARRLGWSCWGLPNYFVSI
jgi:mannan polymerase complexes MNN9 subunit